MAVTAACDDFLAGNPDAIDDIVAASEDPRVQQCVALLAGQRRMGCIQADEVSWSISRYIRGTDAERRSTPLQRPLQQDTSSRAVCASQDVASPMQEPLRIFELAQFVGNAHLDI